MNSSKKPRTDSSLKTQGFGFTLEKPSRLLNSTHFSSGLQNKGYLILKSSQGRIKHEKEKEGSRCADITPRQKTGKKERPENGMARKKTARKNRGRHGQTEK